MLFLKLFFKTQYKSHSQIKEWAWMDDLARFLTFSQSEYYLFLSFFWHYAF